MFSIYPEMRYHYAREVNSLDVSTMKEKTSIFIHVPALIKRKIIVKLHNCCWIHKSNFTLVVKLKSSRIRSSDVRNSNRCLTILKYDVPPMSWMLPFKLIFFVRLCINKTFYFIGFINVPRPKNSLTKKFFNALVIW